MQEHEIVAYRTFARALAAGKIFDQESALKVMRRSAGTSPPIRQIEDWFSQWEIMSKELKRAAAATTDRITRHDRPQS